MKIRIFGAALLLLSGLSHLPTAEAENATVATAFSVGGQVMSPSSFDLAKLEKLQVTSQKVTYSAGKVTTHEFTGVLLWDLLQSAGIILDQSIKNDILHKIVIVTTRENNLRNLRRPNLGRTTRVPIMVTKMSCTDGTTKSQSYSTLPEPRLMPKQNLTWAVPRS